MSLARSSVCHYHLTQSLEETVSESFQTIEGKSIKRYLDETFAENSVL